MKGRDTLSPQAHHVHHQNSKDLASQHNSKGLAAHVPSPSSSPNSFSCCHSPSMVRKKSVAAVTIPPESFFGTPNTRSEENPETMNSPCTHPSLLGAKGPMTSGNLMPQTLSYKGFLHISGTMPESSRPQAIEDHFHNRVNQALARILHALQSCVRCHHHIFQMLFPQFQSCFISSQNAVFAFWVMKILSPVSFRLHLPKGLRCLTSIWLPYSRCPTHLFVVLVQFSPIAAFNTFVDRLA